jgi:hypothetical protein
MINISNHLKHIIQSLIINWKSWMCIHVSLYLINDNSFFISYINYLFILLFSYLSHYILHWKYIYPFNITHIYHHSHSNSFSHIIQIIFEFVSLMFVIAIKYIFMCGKIDLCYINEWIIILYYLFYTTVHNINYSILRVNSVHQIHHQVLFKNMGPDICDIIFDTKHNPESEIENTDHYIPNIIGSTLIVFLLKYLWNTDNKEIFTFIIKYLFIFAVIFLFLTTIYMYNTECDKNNKVLYDDISKIYKLLKH